MSTRTRITLKRYRVATIVEEFHLDEGDFTPSELAMISAHMHGDSRYAEMSELLDSFGSDHEDVSVDVDHAENWITGRWHS